MNNSWNRQWLGRSRPPARVVVVDPRQRMAQERHAALAMQSVHEKLLAEGWTWDGMDGYTAPDVKENDK